ncbi:hypothetical protein Hanom_Chr04g00336101 [Helianthus anomalus]
MGFFLPENSLSNLERHGGEGRGGEGRGGIFNSEHTVKESGLLTRPIGPNTRYIYTRLYVWTEGGPGAIKEAATRDPYFALHLSIQFHQMSTAWTNMSFDGIIHRDVMGLGEISLELWLYKCSWTQI